MLRQRDAPRQPPEGRRPEGAGKPRDRAYAKSSQQRRDIGRRGREARQGESSPRHAGRRRGGHHHADNDDADDERCHPESGVPARGGGGGGLRDGHGSRCRGRGTRPRSPRPAHRSPQLVRLSPEGWRRPARATIDSASATTRGLHVDQESPVHAAGARRSHDRRCHARRRAGASPKSRGRRCATRERTDLPPRTIRWRMAGHAPHERRTGQHRRGALCDGDRVRQRGAQVLRVRGPP